MAILLVMLFVASSEHCCTSACEDRLAAWEAAGEITVALGQGNVTNNPKRSIISFKATPVSTVNSNKIGWLQFQLGTWQPLQEEFQSSEGRKCLSEQNPSKRTTLWFCQGSCVNPITTPNCSQFVEDLSKKGPLQSHAWQGDLPTWPW